MKKTVLIVDDDPVLRFLIRKLILLVDPLVVCIDCKDGEQGLTNLNTLQNTAGSIFILLDINMPVLDGWGFLDGLQSVSPDIIKRVHLYMVTSSTDERDMVRAKEYPVIESFYHKPLSKDDIKVILT